jgi:hypothetical protein
MKRNGEGQDGGSEVGSTSLAGRGVKAGSGARLEGEIVLQQPSDQEQSVVL